MPSNILRFYQTPGLSSGAHEVVLPKLISAVPRLEITKFTSEICYNVSTQNGCNLENNEVDQLEWLFSRSFEKDKLTRSSVFPAERENTENTLSRSVLIEIGPRLNFSTAFSTNAVAICHSVGLKKINRIEHSCRYLIQTHPKDNESTKPLNDTEEQALVLKLHDRMTQCRYKTPITSFEVDIHPEQCYDVDVLSDGRAALEKVNKDLGLAFDDWDLDYYTKLFKERVGRNPTSVECFDLAQSNSEHSRHWFFRGKLVVDGQEVDDSLMKMVMMTQQTSNDNNVIKFSDNSSAIQGYKVSVLTPEDPKSASRFSVTEDTTRHVIFSAETHNFPTGIAPFPGATTGTGGRIRDVQAAGRGAHVVAGTAGYCFGNLQIPGYKMAWEDPELVYPTNMAPAVAIAVEASNGASDYGNKFGEPVLTGFARSFGMRMPNGERREWVKPIMFSGGMGTIDEHSVSKLKPEKGMEVVKIGGPVYRIGVGGGAASSIQVQGDNVSELDFGAVQRGDAEMEQKLNRVVRACLEIVPSNPICSIHDQGAGGNGNVLKEICEPAGSVIRVKDFILGDPTLSVLEIWGAEYQESNALLVNAEDANLLRRICCREKVPVSFVGTITGNGRIVLEDDSHCANGNPDDETDVTIATKRQRITKYPVDLELDMVLGKMPKKVFKLDHVKPKLEPLSLSATLTVREALERILRLPSVASKRYLTNKVDRSVTGLVAQQQCVGPLHTPIADVAVTSLSHFDTKGSATAIGEQPIKGLVDPGCGARMTVGEALTNLVFAKITDLKDVKCSGNWMWAAKLPGEGAALYDTCKAMCEVMAQLGIAVDGGKDSLSMAARVGGDTVKAPGALVVSVYAACPDIRLTVTPDLKVPHGKGKLLYVRMAAERYRLGGSALAQVYQQIGDESPDMDDAKIFVSAFRTTQELISEKLITSGHDISDGGLVTTLLEMAFAGNCGLEANIPYKGPQAPRHSKAIDVLFAEELGLILEVREENIDKVRNAYKESGVPCIVIGQTSALGEDGCISIKVDGDMVLEEKMVVLRDVWEATSFQLERLQSNPRCVEVEEAGLKHRKAPEYKISFEQTPGSTETNSVSPKVAVIREEGSNGDREMVASFYMAGFEVWDVTMNDLCQGAITLESFRGVVFVGGFSYADVLGSAKGWAAVCQINTTARAQFDAFLAREDTFSLGICNGCQLMGLLGWVGTDPNCTSSLPSSSQGVCFTHNTSERFESRFVTVSIQPSPAIMLQGMQDSTLGIWVAHGEGRAQFCRPEILQDVLTNNLAPVRYIDDDGNITTQYPLNPNGSPLGIAALCSPDGRHLAMMPHPERSTLLWQWAWMPEEWRKTLTASPWLRMFQNAHEWCVKTDVKG